MAGAGEWLEKRFAIKERGSSVRRELLGGLVTFLTLSYILFVQPVVMALALPKGTPPAEVEAFKAAVLSGLCVASAAACLLMGWLANLPVALAPAMGHNFAFALFVCAGLGFTWQQALAATLVAGAIFLALSLLGRLLPGCDPRAILFGTIPPSLQNAIAVGIGLLIALVGLEYSGLIIKSADTGLTCGIGHIPWRLLAISLIGLAVFAFLWARNISSAPLWAIAASALTGWLLGAISAPAALLAAPSFGAAWQLDFAGLFRAPLMHLLSAVGLLFFLAVFDTVGTLAGVCQRAGLLTAQAENDKSLAGALVADSSGIVVGALLGTSTITSYVESLAGIQSGARTGLMSIAVAGLFLVAIFFTPLLTVVAAPLAANIGGQEIYLYPCLAPVLIGIGAAMLPCVRAVPWEDATEALPAMLCLFIMPLTLSITDGIAFGFISHVLIKVFAGRSREVRPFIAVCAFLLALRYCLM
ncbi:MAG: NCS2 family permease [Planctomycetota bacterium]|nr:NCS2 family permease [Planctomycetota bacterium]